MKQAHDAIPLERYATIAAARKPCGPRGEEAVERVGGTLAELPALRASAQPPETGSRLDNAAGTAGILVLGLLVELGARR